MDTRKQGLLQAAGVTLYCLAVGLFFGQANKFLPKQDSFLTPIVVLTLFCASALICALIVFYKPYLLFFAGKKTQAIETVMYTAACIFAFAVIGLIGLIILG
ncbi:MAG TPA: hypothetical protein VG895_04090 [Patescibacteria group bacterium]|nr:hypothetical protein [Patescibacteria group bacterium]